MDSQLVDEMRNHVAVFAVWSILASIGLAACEPTATDTVQVTESERCQNLKFSSTTISTAEQILAGSFTPSVESAGRPPTDEEKRRFAALPSFCRVTATLSPTPDSEIRVEVWMPNDAWNGKYLGVGNGAFRGSIRYSSMLAAVERGYATSSTDTGHIGNTANFGLEHPEKVIDFGWRSVHEMTIFAKQTIANYYSRRPEYSYWDGCSAGGRQGLKEAQQFPEDFDGIIAGAPGQDWTGRAGSALRLEKILASNEGARLRDDDRQLVHRGALAACDALDGVEDGVIGSPENCVFDPTVLACKGDQVSSCLTADQVNSVRELYSSPVNPKTNRPIPGLFPGSELGWTDLGWTASARYTGLEQFRYIVFKDADWTSDKFDFASDIVIAEDGDNNTLNALDTDLRPFFQSGGRLIQYHGWNDPQISPGISPQYYLQVAEALGGRDAIDNNYRLFMVPGMSHCSGGEGTDSFDMLGALERWVESGEAPDQVIASRIRPGEAVRTRPLCPYPQVASYSGSGSTDDADNFVCTFPSVAR